MTSTALPAELLSFTYWRQQSNDTPVTPPMTSHFESRKMHKEHTTTLPPISHFDRQLSNMPPLTPLRVDSYYQNSSPDSPMVLTPGLTNNSSSHSLHNSAVEVPPHFFSGNQVDAPQLVDWLDFTRKCSAQFIAEKTCEMICYLWFASSTPSSSSSSLQPNTLPYSNRNNSSSSLQFLASPTFINFMQKLLETTQVSQSVIVLSLHYIFRLKERNRFTAGQPGSEFRIAVAGLMMANKFLDDNTYTNKTWSEVSGIELAEINKMEREFLMGIDFSLYVDKPTYESWLNLLKGLVMAKERDTRQWRRSHRLARPTARQPIHYTSAPSSRTYTYSSTRYRSAPRARSTSPSTTLKTYVHAYPAPRATNADVPAFTYHDQLPRQQPQDSPTPARSGAKRSAATAFSPTSATFSHLPAKRPVSISLVIPDGPVCGSGPNSSSHSPSEPLQSFAKLSLGHASSPAQPAPGTPGSAAPPPSVFVSAPRPEYTSSTLATAYALDPQRRPVVPQHLYFYTLACSPLEEESRWRKARLRCHQPPPPPSTLNTLPPFGASQRAPLPRNIQSAHASPHDAHAHLHLPPAAMLPGFHDTDCWRGQFAPKTAIPPSSYECELESSIPSAPFANAGPPGVHYYSSTPFQRTSPVYAHNWSRGRPL